MKLHEAFPSPYLKAADVEDEELVLTIDAVSTETLGDGGERRCVRFEETDKLLILNKTNWLSIAEISEEKDDARWSGTKIRLVRKRVNFKGDLVDAIRVEAAEVPF